MTDPTSLPRRDFIKLALVGSAGVAAAACSPRGDALVPLLVPEEHLVPGVAYWSRGLCRECGAGCGVLVRRMEALVPVTRDGQRFRQSRLVAKKLEGNPDHPLNRGGLCARGQAALEATYHPLRLTGPLRRAGKRGEGVFQPTSWAAALASLRQAVAAAGAGQVGWLGRPLRGTEAGSVGDWLRQVQGHGWEYRALPASRATADAARLAELADADFILSFGNFLESWPAQTAATRAYSRFRRRPGTIFFQVEPRLSLTAANADRWVPIRPGTEGILALAVAGELLRARSGRAAQAGPLQVPEGLQAYTPETAERLCDVPAGAIRQIGRALAAARRPLVAGGPAAYAYAHGDAQADAIGFLASLARAGSAAGAGTESHPGEEALAWPAAPLSAAPGGGSGALPFQAPLPPVPRVLIVHDVNPVFSAPPGWELSAWLRAIPEVVVLGTLPDESVLEADLVLPLSTALESWSDDEWISVDGRPIATLSPPAMLPLHDTKGLLEIVAGLGSATGPTGPLLAPAGQAPGEAAIRRRWQSLQERYAPGQSFPEFWAAALERGGFWPPAAQAAAGPETTEGGGTPAPGSTLPAAARALAADAGLQGRGGADYPYHLRLYESPIWGEGRGSWLTWLQELPDPTTSALWSSWVEIHPQLAARLGLSQGDGVWVESSAGRIELPVFLFPGLHPDTVAIPTGQGHRARAAVTNRGANPYEILASEREPASGALAWEATRVRLVPSGNRPPLPLFGRSLQHPITHR